MHTTIYFIRHADSHFVLGKERERPLSEEGVLAAGKLVSSLQNVHFDAVFSSPYKRAIQTLDGLVDPVDIILEEDLRERTLKGPYKLTAEEIDLAIKQSFENVDYCLDGGESVRQVQYRALPVIFGILENQNYNTVAIGTHGNIMTSIINYFDDTIGYSFWKSTKKPDIHKLVFNSFHLISIKKITF
ncbi:histidine phosphatase family protein [Solibacillus sp. CAU 1738]|uniref:histidine phosphatase family protein n=1 Tax=Solibacillus sp. CAU 1738 TaxID=3140363 RepID=UPI0032604096